MPLPYRVHGPLLFALSRDEVRWHPEGVLCIDAEGRILFSGDATQLPESCKALPSRQTDNLILPGFVDAHVHLPQYDCRGKFGTSLLEWLDRFIFPEEERFADAEVARDVSQRFFRGLLSCGSTTAMVYSSVHTQATDIAFEVADKTGGRIIMGKLLMDREAPSALLEKAGTGLRTTEELIEKWHRRNPRLGYAVTPRFAPTCTPELLEGAGRLARKYGTWIQTHINESPGEIELVRKLFAGSRNYSDVYQRAGLLTPLTVLGHNVHTDTSQLRLLGSSECAIAHCPDSNLFLGSGRFPLELHEEAGLRIGLGSDVGAGTTLSMFHHMRAMSYVQGHSLHPYVPLFYATLGGAEALRMQDDIGNLSEGKYADFLEVEIDRHFYKGQKLEDLRPLEIASAVVYRCTEAQIRSVHVAGAEVYRSTGSERNP